MRFDRLRSEDAGAEWSNGADVAATAGQIRYSFAPDTPESPLQTNRDLHDVLMSVGTGESRAVARFSRLLGERTIRVEVLGSAQLDRLVLRWFDTGVKSKAAAPWYFAVSRSTGFFTHIPLGDVPPNFLELSPDDYEKFPGLDLASVPEETVMTAAQAALALRWFLTSGPDEVRTILDRIER